jgi:ATP-dependent exoDNAse (exonuclease V) alpha subunit
MARLLEAVRPSARLVLVGDPDQLSSVEAGAVLAISREPLAHPMPTWGATGQLDLIPDQEMAPVLRSCN